MSRVRDDGEANLAQVRLDRGDVELLLLTVSHMLLLVVDGSASSRGGGRGNRGSLAMGDLGQNGTDDEAGQRQLTKMKPGA